MKRPAAKPTRYHRLTLVLAAAALGTAALAADPLRSVITKTPYRGSMPAMPGRALSQLEECPAARPGTAFRQDPDRPDSYLRWASRG